MPQSYHRNIISVSCCHQGRIARIGKPVNNSSAGDERNYQLPYFRYDGGVKIEMLLDYRDNQLFLKYNSRTTDVSWTGFSALTGMSRNVPPMQCRWSGRCRQCEHCLTSCLKRTCLAMLKYFHKVSCGIDSSLCPVFRYVFHSVLCKCALSSLTGNVEALSTRWPRSSWRGLWSMLVDRSFSQTVTRPTWLTAANSRVKVAVYFCYWASSPCRCLPVIAACLYLVLVRVGPCLYV